MAKSNIIGIPKIMQKILETIGYQLPKQFNKPTKEIYRYHYCIIITIVVYAILTAIDVVISSQFALRPHVLWLLSTITIIVTQKYKVLIGKRKVMKNQAHKNNRRNINVVCKYNDIEFNERIYTKPLMIEGVWIFFAICFAILVYSGVNWNLCKIEIIGWLNKIIFSLLAIYNGCMLCVDNFAEFYHATDIINKKEQSL